MKQSNCPHDFVSYLPNGSDKKFKCGDCGQRFVTLPEEMPDSMINTGFDMELFNVLHKFTIGETTVGKSYYESKLPTKDQFTQYLDEFLPMVPIYRDVVGCGTPNTRVKIGEHKRKSNPFEIDRWFAKIDQRAMRGDLNPMVSDAFSDVQGWHYLDDTTDSRNKFVMVRFIDNTRQRVLLDWAV